MSGSSFVNRLSRLGLHTWVYKVTSVFVISTVQRTVSITDAKYLF